MDGVRARAAVHRSRSRGAPFAASADLTRETNRLATNNESDKARAMSGFKEPNFADRQKAAQQARQNILNKFRSQPGLDDPAVIKRPAQPQPQAAHRPTPKLPREPANAAHL